MKTKEGKSHPAQTVGEWMKASYPNLEIGSQGYFEEVARHDLLARSPTKPGTVDPTGFEPAP